jgi:hypothetical protein
MEETVERQTPIYTRRPQEMLTAIIVTGIILAALGYGLRAGQGEQLIIRRPYNNRYNDASGAREDHLS